MGDVSDIGELLTAHRVKAAKRAGWAKTAVVGLVAAIAQLVQMHKADAEKGAQSQAETDRMVRIEMKLDSMKDEIHYLSERTTKLEVESHLRRP